MLYSRVILYWELLQLAAKAVETLSSLSTVLGAAHKC